MTEDWSEGWCFDVVCNSPSHKSPVKKTIRVGSNSFTVKWFKLFCSAASQTMKTTIFASNAFCSWSYSLLGSEPQNQIVYSKKSILIVCRCIQYKTSFQLAGTFLFFSFCLSTSIQVIKDKIGELSCAISCLSTCLNTAELNLYE